MAATKPPKQQMSKPGLVLVAIALCAVCGFLIPDDDEDQGRASTASSPSPRPSPSPSRTVQQEADSAAWTACGDFAAGYSSSMTVKARTALAKEVTSAVNRSDTAGIRPAGSALTKSAKAGGKAWKASAKKFTALCKARGWIDFDAPEWRSTDGSDGGSSSGGDSRRKGKRGWW